MCRVVVRCSCFLTWREGAKAEREREGALAPPRCGSNSVLLWMVRKCDVYSFFCSLRLFHFSFCLVFFFYTAFTTSFGAQGCILKRGKIERNA